MHRRLRLTCRGIVLVALASGCVLCNTTTRANGYRPIPVVDGAGALGQATGPNGAMSGHLYVPERQATYPPVYRPRGRANGRGGYRAYRGYHRPESHRRDRRDDGYRRHRGAYRHRREPARGARGRHAPHYGRRGGGVIDRDRLVHQPLQTRPIDPHYVSPNRRRLDERFGQH